MAELEMVTYNDDGDLDVKITIMRFNGCWLMVAMRNWVRFDNAMHQGITGVEVASMWLGCEEWRGKDDMMMAMQLGHRWLWWWLGKGTAVCAVLGVWDDLYFVLWWCYGGEWEYVVVLSENQTKQCTMKCWIKRCRVMNERKR